MHLLQAAEGIPTIYLSRIESDTVVNLEDDAGLDKFVTLVLNTAIQMGECNCVIKFNEMEDEFRLVGMWGGKSMTDWQNDHILLAEVRSSRS